MRSGIYKIENPTGKIYIGQSIDIEERWRTYRSSLINSTTQKALHRSFSKYGVESHLFEVVEMCEVALLNQRERYWQDHYNVLQQGLNCVLQSTTEKRRVVSEEMKSTISEKITRIQANPEVRKKKSEITKKAYKDNPERRKQQAERSRGSKWYNNGTKETLTKEHPGEGYVLGKLTKPPTGSTHPRSRPLAKLDPSTSEVLRTYDVVREVEQDGYKASGVVTALYRGFQYKGFKWCFLDRMPVDSE